MSKIKSLYGATPVEIFQSGLENLDDIEAVVAGVLWPAGTIPAGWSPLDVANLARLILVLDEAQRRRTLPETDL